MVKTTDLILMGGLAVGGYFVLKKLEEAVAAPGAALGAIGAGVTGAVDTAARGLLGIIGIDQPAPEISPKSLYQQYWPTGNPFLTEAQFNVLLAGQQAAREPPPTDLVSEEPLGLPDISGVVLTPDPSGIGYTLEPTAAPVARAPEPTAAPVAVAPPGVIVPPLAAEITVPGYQAGLAKQYAAIAAWQARGI